MRKIIFYKTGEMLTMVEGDQEFNQYFVENYFYTEYGHKDVERAYTKMS